jgi:hypothetical protein
MEHKCSNIIEELAYTQMEEDPTSSLKDTDVRMLSTAKRFASTNQRKMMVVYLD